VRTGRSLRSASTGPTVPRYQADQADQGRRSTCSLFLARPVTPHTARVVAQTSSSRTLYNSPDTRLLACTMRSHSSCRRHHEACRRPSATSARAPPSAASGNSVSPSRPRALRTARRVCNILKLSSSARRHGASLARCMTGRAAAVLCSCPDEHRPRSKRRAAVAGPPAKCRHALARPSPATALTAWGFR